MKSLTDLNTYSAQPVAYADQGTGAQTLANRYQINGLLDSKQSVMSNIEKIASAAGSWLSYDIQQGQWGVVINNSGTSIASFDDTNILGNITISGTGLKDLYNGVKVQFPHRDLKDSADFVQIDIPSGDRNANEGTNALQLAYDIINEPIQAQLLGFIELKQSRINTIIHFQSDYSRYNVKAGDIIDITNSRFGYTAKLFRVLSVVEIQDGINLRIEITAIEYDPNVYSVADLYRYTRIDENGIISIGDIGIPGTPQISKFEKDSRPRIDINSTTPTGIVEGMEYWVTNDVNVQNDSNRSYRLIATVRPPVGSINGIFTSGTEAIAEYDSLSAENFLVKTRGFNASTVGPFSSPSGLVEFVPVQTTQAIGPETSVLDSAGNLITLLGANYLLGQLGDLFTSSGSTSSIFKSVFDLFKTQTGVDLVGQASSGSLVVSANLAIQDEGTTISSPTSAINFVGSGVVATNSGSVVTVNIGGGGGTGTNSGGLVITSITPNRGATTGGTSVTIAGINLNGATAVTFGGTAATNVSESGGAVTCLTPAHSTATVDVVVTTPLGNTTFSQGFTYYQQYQYLTQGGTLPPDRTTGVDPVNGYSSDLAPIRGSYYITYNNGGPLYGPLSAGTGNAKLYKSDGTLVETKSASSFIFHNDIVEIPFSTRTLGTDYYILLEQGAVKYCDLVNPAISAPGVWNFNTPLYETDPYVFSAGTITSSTVRTPVAVAVGPHGTNVPKESTLSIVFDMAIKKGTGNFYVKDYVSNTTVATAAASGGTVNGNTISFPVSLASAVVNGGHYYVSADAGAVKSLDIDCYAIGNPSQAITKADGWDFTVIDALRLISFSVESTPLSDPTLVKVNPQSNIVLVFNRAVSFGTTGNFTLHKVGGGTEQTFSVTSRFDVDGTNEVITLSGDSITLNPTKDMTVGATYYINGYANSVVDSYGNKWAGLSDSSTVKFTVDPGPKPVVGAINDDSETITMAFDREITPGAGTIQIYNESNVLVAEVPSTDPAITYS